MFYNDEYNHCFKGILTNLKNKEMAKSIYGNIVNKKESENNGYNLVGVLLPTEEEQFSEIEKRVKKKT